MTHCSALQALRALSLSSLMVVNFVVLFIKMIKAQLYGPMYMIHSLLVTIRHVLGWDIISTILFDTLK